MNQTAAAFLALLFATIGACASSGGTASQAQAGATGSSGSPGAAGSPAATGGALGQAGNNVGGAASAASAGAGGLGASGGLASTGGVGGSNGGSAGTTSVGGSGGASPANPSPGCAKSTPRPADGKVTVTGQALHLFPASYDGTKPFPLLIALHACGNQNTEFADLTTGTGFETSYVRTFPNTPDSMQCWTNYNGDIARILAQYDDLMNTYCIDMNRVFGIAHSSGAQLLVKILSQKADAQHLNLKAVSPVAADPFDVALPIPVLYIDGKMDSVRGANSATDAVAKFRAANKCAGTSKPYAPVMSCMSSEPGHPMVTPGCISYDSCSVPTIWCSHNDPFYGGTEHGVPCFAIKSMYDFFATLP